MKNYNVYFEIFGKKMKVKVMANSAYDAQLKIKEKVLFHKIEEDKNDIFNQSVEILDSIINFLDNKKTKG